MEEKGKATVITYIQAIYYKCENVAWYIEMVEVMRRAEKEKGIEIRLKGLDDAIKEMKDFFSNDIDKIFRRTMLDMDADKQTAYRNEIKTSLDELRFKLSDAVYSKSLELYNSVYLKVITALETDMDFIKGKIQLIFTPQGSDGYFEVVKNEIKRRYTPEKYFDLDLRNWELVIDSLKLKSEKIQAVNNGIFALQKQRYDEGHPKILMLVDKNIEQLNNIKWYINSNYPDNTAPLQNIEVKSEQKKIEIKPSLKAEAVQPLYEILKDFFSPDDQNELIQILKTGEKASKKLLFKSNGNRLTDTFKKLFEYDFITGCDKKNLINWIIENFEYLYRNTVKSFIYDTVEKTISRKDGNSMSPLIEIKNNKILRIETPRSRANNKY